MRRSPSEGGRSLRLVGRVLVGLWGVLVIVGFRRNTFPLFAREIGEGPWFIIFGAVIWLTVATTVGGNPRRTVGPCTHWDC